MQVMYCSSCQQQTGWGRRIGVGSLVLVLFTCGFWIVALPFYPIRCSRCGIGVKTEKALPVVLFLIAIGLLFIFIATH